MIENTLATQDYVFGSSWEEVQRLQTLAQLVLPSTRQFLQEAGITAGMKVLDLGCGAGDVSLLIAELVGPEGRVVGIDRNPAILEFARTRTAGLTNVFFVDGDIISSPISDDFDAVIGRLILQHLSDPSTLLRKLASYVRPGGIIAFQEADLTRLGTSVPALPLLEQVGNWCRDAMRCAGVDIQMGLRLYNVFTHAGLPAPQVHCTSFVGGGPDWLWYDMIAERVRSLLPIIFTYGIATEEEIAIDTLAQRCCDAVVSQRGVAMAPDFFSAWTRTSVLTQ